MPKPTRRAAAGSVLLAGHALLLQVHNSLLTGAIGIVLLFSAARFCKIQADWV